MIQSLGIYRRILWVHLMHIRMHGHHRGRRPSQSIMPITIPSHRQFHPQYLKTHPPISVHTHLARKIRPEILRRARQHCLHLSVRDGEVRIEHVEVGGEEGLHEFLPVLLLVLLVWGVERRCRRGSGLVQSRLLRWGRSRLWMDLLRGLGVR